MKKKKNFTTAAHHINSYFEMDHGLNLKAQIL